MTSSTQDSNSNMPHFMKSPFRYRAFLSHEGTLKPGIISVLMAEIERYNMTSRVFFDQNMDRGGALDETLKRRLLDGLKNSEYLVVFITPEFIRKKWPWWELRQYLEMMNADSRKKMLPVFYGVSVVDCKNIIKDKAGRELLEKIDPKPSDVGMVLSKIVEFCGIERLRANNFRTDVEVMREIMSTLFKAPMNAGSYDAGPFAAGTPWPEQLPANSGRYCGNETLLEEMGQGLRVGPQEGEKHGSSETLVYKCIISGSAGVGKSALAAQFACENRNEFPGGVYWVESENEMDVFTSFKVVAAQIRTFVEESSCSADGRASVLINTVQRVHKALEGIQSHKIKKTTQSRPSQKSRANHFDASDDIETSTFESDMEMAARDVRDLFHKLSLRAGRWLIIFDNLDDISGANDFRAKWIPRSGQGNVVLTTKMRPHLVPYIYFRDSVSLTIDIKLETLSLEAARRFLLFSIGCSMDSDATKEERGAVDRIVGPLGLDGLALAIRQASLYIRHNQASLADYADELEELGPFDSISQWPAEMSKSLSSSWAVSKRKLSQEARELLSILCWLSPHDTSVSIGWKVALDGVNSFGHSSLKARYGSHLLGVSERDVVKRRKICSEILNEMVGVGLIEVQSGSIKAHRLMYLHEQMQQRSSVTEGSQHCALESAARLIFLESKLRTSRSTQVQEELFSVCEELKNRRMKFGELVTEMGEILLSQVSSAVEAFRVLSYAADLEVPDAKAMLGVCFLAGSGVLTNEKKGVAYLREAANLGSVVALRHLGRCHQHGVGTNKDISLAVEYYTRAAVANEITAIGVLGNCYYFGDGVDRDEAYAVELWSRAANLKDSRAVLALGSCYESGNGVTKSSLRAVEFYKKAMELNSSRGMCFLGNCYLYGWGVEKDPTRAVELYVKAADMNDSDGMVRLGYCCASRTGVEKSVTRAVQLYKRAMDLNNPDGMWRLGSCYEYGEGVEKNVIRAVELYRKAADMNSSDGMCRLGSCYEHGTGVAKSVARAVELYRSAVNMDNSNGMWRLGFCYEDGVGVEKDASYAVELYKQAAELNDSRAIWNLGRCYEIGIGVDKDTNRAVELYKQAADLNNSNGMWRLGCCYEDGLGVEKDASRAIELYRQAADLDDSDAMCRLGRCYEYGIGLERDVNRAVELYEQAADFNDSDAIVSLGRCWEDGVSGEKNENRAAELYKQAADLNNSNGMWRLGCCYEDGLGVEKDASRAIELYRQAADLDDSYAMWRLGDCYEDGVGVEKDVNRAAELYKQAADLNDSDAMCSLGRCYEYGIGIDKDMSRATDLYKKAADLDDSSAMEMLGQCYEDGTGVEKDVNRAAELYKQAADLNDSDAMWNLGRCYQNGIGVKKDMARALALYRKAVDGSDSNGMWALGRCFEYGNGVEKNEDKAFDMYSQAVALGDGDGMWNLGRCFHFGKGVGRDEAYAVEIYRQAMAAHDTLATSRWEAFTVFCKDIDDEYKGSVVPVNKQIYPLDALQGIALLAHCYANGEGVGIDVSRALEFYAQAVELGDVIAMVEMGKLLVSKNGVKTNEAQAVILFQQAANHGYVYGALALGDCYENGVGIERNTEKSCEMYKNIARGGGIAGDIGWGRCYEYGRGVRKSKKRACEFYEKAAKALEVCNAVAAQELRSRKPSIDSRTLQRGALACGLLVVAGIVFSKVRK